MSFLYWRWIFVLLVIVVLNINHILQILLVEVYIMEQLYDSQDVAVI